MPDAITIDPNDFTPGDGGGDTTAPKPKSGFFAKKAITIDDKDFTPTDMSGSVFQPKQSLVNRAETAVKAAAPTVAQVGLPLAVGAALGPEAGFAARAIGVGAAGAAGNILSAKMQGRNATLGEALTGAAWNVGFEGLGQAAGAGLRAIKGKAAEVASQFAPAGERSVLKTGKQVRAAVNVRQLLKEQGFTDAEATTIAANPEASGAFERNLQYAQDTKQAFQQANDVKRAELTKRFDDSIGPYKNKNIGAAPIEDAITRVLAENGEQASPGLRSFLQKQAANISGNIEGAPASMKVPMDVTIDEAQRFKDQLWDFYPRTKGGNAFDQKIITQVSKAVEDQVDSGLRTANAPAESIAEYHAARQDWHVWKTAMADLDPRSKTFGTDVADALYGNIQKNPEQAVYLARMVTAADKLNNGVKRQFAQGFLEHFMNESAGESGVIGQMQAFSKLRREFARSGRGTGQEFLNEVFGADSPLANETKYARIIGKVGDPKLVAEAQNNVRNTGKQGDIQWLVKYAAILGGTNIAHQMLGEGKFKGGLFSVMTDPVGWGVLAAYMGGKKFNAAMLSAGGKLSTYWADYLMSGGSQKAFDKFAQYGANLAGGTAGAIATAPPSQEQPTQAPPQPITP